MIFLTIFLTIRPSIFTVCSRVLLGASLENKTRNNLAKLPLYTVTFPLSVQPCSFPNELANGKKYATRSTPTKELSFRNFIVLWKQIDEKRIKLYIILYPNTFSTFTTASVRARLPLCPRYNPLLPNCRGQSCLKRATGYTLFQTSTVPEAISIQQ